MFLFIQVKYKVMFWFDTYQETKVNSKSIKSLHSCLCSSFMGFSRVSPHLVYTSSSKYVVFHIMIIVISSYQIYILRLILPIFFFKKYHKGLTYFRKTMFTICIFLQYMHTTNLLIHMQAYSKLHACEPIN